MSCCQKWIMSWKASLFHKIRYRQSFVSGFFTSASFVRRIAMCLCHMDRRQKVPERLVWKPPDLRACDRTAKVGTVRTGAVWPGSVEADPCLRKRDYE